MFSRLCNVPPNKIATIGDMPEERRQRHHGKRQPRSAESATFVTDTNENDGFAKAMERLVQSRAAPA